MDGFLARRFHWQTGIGAYLDPVADKLLLTSVYVSLAVAGCAPIWLVALIVGRYVVILSMVAAALAITRFRDFLPTIWGKINTGLEILTALVLVTGCAGIVRCRLLRFRRWRGSPLRARLGVEFTVSALV